MFIVELAVSSLAKVTTGTNELPEIPSRNECTREVVRINARDEFLGESASGTHASETARNGRDGRRIDMSACDEL